MYTYMQIFLLLKSRHFRECSHLIFILEFDNISWQPHDPLPKTARSQNLIYAYATSTTIVHSGHLLTVIWWSHSPALRQCRPVHFLWLVQKPGMDFQ